jgi:hypothetical protein
VHRSMTELTLTGHCPAGKLALDGCQGCHRCVPKL